MAEFFFDRVLPLLWVALFLAFFCGIVWVIFWLAAVEPGALHRVRPWIAIVFLWMLFGLGVLIFLGFLSGGMIETDGWQMLVVIVIWPWFMFDMLGRI